MNTGSRQAGITLTGFAFTAVFVIAAALLVMKLWPLYNERFKVMSAMASIAERPDIAQQSTYDIRKLMLRNFEVQDVDEFNERNIGKHLSVQRVQGGGSREMRFRYERRAPLFGDLDVVLKFDESRSIAVDTAGP